MEKFTLPDPEKEQSILKSLRIKIGLMDRVNEIADKANISVNGLLIKCIEFALNNLSDDDLKKLSEEKK